MCIDISFRLLYCETVLKQAKHNEKLTKKVYILCNSRIMKEYKDLFLCLKVVLAF